jgi:hypothetical protein
VRPGAKPFYRLPWSICSNTRLNLNRHTAPDGQGAAPDDAATAVEGLLIGEDVDI